MTLIRTARRYAASAPREAIADAIGLGGVCFLIFAGFTVPDFL